MKTHEMTATAERFTVAMAGPAERERIYAARHAVYAAELRQHGTNAAGRLTDRLDDHNIYLVARAGDELAGFVSITTPGDRGTSTYSIDKYFSRESLPFPVDADLYEVRLLTVLKPHRGSEVAGVLMYAAFRWVEAHGGTHIAAIGRREVAEMYIRAGLRPAGRVAQSGAVTYDLLHAGVGEIRETLQSLRGLLARLESKADWRLNVPFRKPAACFHGGAFFSAIGDRFQSLERRHAIINADVLDAWFPPSLRVIDALQQHLPWLLQTSPPTGCEGLVEAIAEARGIKPSQVLPGAGSSDLIFRCMREWLTANSHVLILDPTYGEYAHVLEQVIGCTVDRLPLQRTENYQVSLERLKAALADGYDLVVLVNPNSPTGQFLSRKELEPILRGAPTRTRIWIDETYVDYIGAGESMERFAAASENVIVCKSMSKVYALSGARVAYICAGEHQLETLRAITPPWVVSLPAQVSAVMALHDPEYYASRYSETKRLRIDLQASLRALGWEVNPGSANFLLCHLPVTGSTSSRVVSECRQHGLFLRDASPMGSQLGKHAIRVAVKDRQTNERMVEILRRVG